MNDVLNNNGILYSVTNPVVGDSYQDVLSVYINDLGFAGTVDTPLSDQKYVAISTLVLAAPPSGFSLDTTTAVASSVTSSVLSSVFGGLIVLVAIFLTYKLLARKGVWGRAGNPWVDLTNQNPLYDAN